MDYVTLYAQPLMKILLLGEYSNVHATLAKGLKTLGHEVTVLSNGDFWKNYPRDIDMVRTYTKWGGIRYLLRMLRILPKLKGYDIVQLISPMFLELKAEHITPFYHYLRRYNKKIVLGAFGMDYYWVSTCCYEKKLRYSDFNIGDSLRTTPDALKERKDWIGTAKERLNRMIAKECDGIVAGLYEYWACYDPIFPQKTIFIPYPIQMPEQATSIEHSEGCHRQEATSRKLRLFIGINKERSAYKGTDIMLQAAKDIVRELPKQVELKIAESVPFEEYQHLMDHSDAILDQLYSYTPSMNSLLAMSKGIISIGGGEPENYEIIHEETLRPIINVEPTYESVCNALRQLVNHPENIAKLQAQSIAYIEKHHEYKKVAAQYADYYQKLLSI